MKNDKLIEKFRHVGIITRNLKEALYFYCELLGCKVVVELIEEGPYISKLIGIENCKIKVAKVASPDGTVLEIIQFLTPDVISTSNDRFNVIGFNHICFSTDNIEKIYEKLKNKNIKFFSPPLKSPYDPVKTMFCYAPDNSIVQFVEVIDTKTIRKGLE